ncbi:acidic mammalian chitinase-like [Lampris incognitus]|uniref:acidic mammalian chitinase-like n=1 Tax=Lampris incognitus TaxID=2546036 RepID=UPI0024B4B424|nr:acidic mammalian chitinase-like [Lampris incognitus]
MARLIIPTALAVLLTLHIASSTRLVCHMTNWAQYRPGIAKFTSSNVDPFLCTHVIYTMATINNFNKLIPVELNDDQQYRSLNNLKSINPALMTLLSVGGVANGISVFIPMIAKPESRAVFIKSAISYLRTHNFDGLNLAWEFPGQNGSPPEVKERFTQLVKELDKAFLDEATATKKTQLLLTANVAALPPTIDRSYEVNKIAPHFDFINVMTYDYHGHWDLVTGHNSPLYRSNVDSGSNAYHNINASISHWLANGMPADKLLLGLPTYGRTFRLTSSATGLGAPTKGPADAGPYTRTAGFWSYYEVCNFITSATVAWISEQQVPYATFGNAWVGYDSLESIAAKVQWLNANNLGGAHVWTLDMDDFGGSFCKDGQYPLVSFLRNAMGFPPKPTMPPALTTTKNPVTSFCTGRPDGLYENPADKTTYFHCFKGNTYLQQCQPGLIYWDSCKCCNWP